MMCPFCVDEDFSLIELKTHLLSGKCEAFNKTASARPRPASPAASTPAPPHRE
jgi:hypothetical protein